MNIGCTWNCEIRNNGTASYCMPALKELGHTVKHYQGRGPVGAHDFYLYVDDGRDDMSWNPPHPCAYWAIDTHLGYDYRLWKASYFDRVFVAQKEAVDQFAKDGVAAEWLPLACHPFAHPSKEELIGREWPAESLEEKWDWSFVGFLNDAKGEGSHSRVDYLDALQAAIPNGWISVNVFFEHMAQRFINARLGFHVSIKNDLAMRVFEVLSTGTALLVNRDAVGLSDLFTEGEDFFGYTGPEEMVEVAKIALSDEALRRRIAGNGFSKVRAGHKYTDRMATIIERMNHA